MVVAKADGGERGEGEVKHFQHDGIIMVILQIEIWNKVAFLIWVTWAIFKFQIQNKIFDKFTQDNPQASEEVTKAKYERNELQKLHQKWNQ